MHVKYYFFFLILYLSCFQKTFSQNNKSFFVVSGQSNAVGMGNTSQFSPLVNIDAYFGILLEYSSNSQKFIQRYNDPIGENVPVGQGVPDAIFNMSNAVSAWPAFARKYLEMRRQPDTDHTMYLVQAARGATGCHSLSFTGTDHAYNTWSREDLLFSKSVEKINKALSKACIPINGIIWLQGESDAQAVRRNAITKEQYKEALQDLIARYRQEFGASLKFYIIKTARAWLKSSTCPSPCSYSEGNYYDCCLANNANNGYDQVRQMQEEVAAGDPNTFIVYEHPQKSSRESPNFTEMQYYKDGTHYLKATYDSIGYRSARQIFIYENNGYKK